MPNLSSYSGNDNSKNFESDDRTIEWLRPSDLAKDEEHFCIEKITESKGPDVWGKNYWYLEIVLPNHPIDIIYLTKLAKTGGERDRTMNQLREALVTAQKTNDSLVHGCCFIELKPKADGHNPFVHLTAHTGPCACGYQAPSRDEGEYYQF